MLRRGKPGAPDFVGVGTHLAGGEWWLKMLAKHPQIACPAGRDPSPCYFAPFCTRPMTDDDVADYHRRFRRPSGGIAGEWSNRYIYDHWIPPLLPRAAPDARLLVLLRDPVELYHRSLGYRHGKRRSWRQRSMRDEAIYMAEEVHRCRYATQLRVLTTFFDRERILILQMERCLRDPLAEYARTLRFLGVDDGFVPRQLRRPPRTDDTPVEHARLLRPFGLPPSVNVQPLRRLAGLPVPVEIELWEDIRASLLAELTEEIQGLLTYVPDWDLSLWPSFAHLGSTEKLS